MKNEPPSEPTKAIEMIEDAGLSSTVPIKEPGSTNNPDPKRGSKRWVIASLWLARIIVAVAFVLSGWSKAVDPWGFVYKIGEYLSVWHVSVSHELILTAAVVIAVTEFAVGVSMLLGLLRRWTLICALTIMAFMLPLSVYIALADPVSDCGCFGDLWIISNSLTLVKNIIIAGALVWIAVNGNRSTSSLFPLSTQWLALVATFAYILIVAFIGYQIQPLVDFRAYKIGSDLSAFESSADETNEEEAVKFVYSKDGNERVFSMDNLPDSTWAFISRLEPQIQAFPNKRERGFAVFDEDGEDVSSEIIEAQGDQLLIIINDLTLSYLSRARFINQLADNFTADGGNVIGLVGAPWQQIEQWSDLTLPTFEAFSVDDVSLKELARGKTALVYLHDGKIVWKRAATSLPADFNSIHSSIESFSSLKPIDDRRLIWQLTGGYITLLFVISLLRRLRK